MTHGVDDDLHRGYLVENEIGIRGRHQAANDRIIRANANIRIGQKQVNNCLYSRLDAFRTLRRMGSDVVEGMELRSASAGRV